MLETLVELQSSRALFGRIFSYLDIEPEIVEDGDAVDLDPATTRGVTSFEHVHFHYPDTDVSSIGIRRAPTRSTGTGMGPATALINRPSPSRTRTTAPVP